MSTFKIKGPIPTAESDVETLADYFEIKAICSFNNEVSLKAIIMQFIKPGDEFEDVGITDQEDLISEKLDPVIEAVNRRIANSRGNYPFSIEMEGYVIKFNGLTTFSSYLYVYLLLATRLNMNTDKVFDNVDGTELFEKISALVAQTYFGDRSASLVFGTAVSGSFEEKVNILCSKINEGVSFFNHGRGVITENDDTLDIVVWKHFEDQLSNKLIGFGQCKTGTSWEKHRKDLQPSDFCRKWLHTNFSQDPVRLFFIAEVLERNKFWKRAVDSGIMFDRIRIMDFIPTNVDTDLEKSICSWSKNAVKFTCKTLLPKNNLTKAMPKTA